MQSKAMTQSDKLHHGGVFGLNGPSYSVVAHMVGQLNQQFKQSSNNAHFMVGDVNRISIRTRLVMHDACVLSFQAIDASLDSAMAGCIEQNELYYWKRDQGVISND